jgi:nitrous oxidase accessory protein NosD
MHVPSPWRLRVLAAVALSTVGLAGVSVAAASAHGTRAPKPPTLFVNGSILSGYGHSRCSSAAYTTISAAVAAAAPGSRIIVCPGTYHEDVTVTTPVTIEGIHATVDATGLDNGFTLPAPAAGTRVEGFTVENALGEGILAVSTTNVSIVDNTVENNDKGERQPGYLECEVTPENEFPDCGEGVHLMGTTNSRLIGNTIRANSGGVLMSDETGPTDGNVVAHNHVVDNVDDCGITLAGHNPGAAPGGVPNPAAAGVYNNLIADNVSTGNGVKGEGGGVLLAAGIPIGGGAVYDNTVTGNFLEGNALAGVTVHNHFPNQDLNGNRIVNNRIGTNNVNGDPDFFPVVDPSTTGIFVGTAGSPLTITIKHNVIFSNAVGIFLTGPLNTEQIKHNVFIGVTTDVVGP